MKQNASSRKLNAQAQENIASILLFDISDPRLRSVTITGCEVSFDRSACNVFYAAPAGEYETTKAAFEKAKGRIRSMLAKRLSWRVAPELRFILDTSVDEAQRIATALLKEEQRPAYIPPEEEGEEQGEAVSDEAERA